MILRFMLIISFVVAVGVICYCAFQPPIPVPAAITPSPNAYDDFIAAGNLMKDGDKIDYAVMSRHFSGRPIDHPYTLGEKTALLQDNQRALARLRLGLTHECVNPLSRTSDFGFSKLQPFHSLDRLLTLETQVQSAKGDYPAAMDSCLDRAQYGAVLIGDHTSVDVSRGLRFQRVSFTRGWDEMRDLNSQSAAHAALRLENIDRATAPLEAMRAEEKWAGLTAIQQLAVPPNRRQDPFFRAFQRSNERHFADEMDLLIQASRRPWSPAIKTAPAGLNPIYSLAQMLEPIDNNGFQYYHTAANRRLLLTALALNAYHGATGTYPASLSQLTPRYLSSVPRDPFSPSSSPLQYKQRGETYLLYSVGPDAKDNGGAAIITISVNHRPVTGAQKYFVKSDSVGDIVAGVNK
ncbi:hypothetical protein CCAX7_28870 [Capsulimonas corticalis]|uniref:Uncharacterized protein n=2 Tax=Capsulimonas corticalis TaxID=2219043 RepID=A0A9N7QE40_9BACT|nr:hypothetical protein CCAX7_28870 [Capsulimonas corticalis]